MLDPKKSLDPVTDAAEIIKETTGLTGMLSGKSLEEPHITQTVRAFAPTVADSDELSAGGSTPDPESDDDTLANAQAMGMQLEEDDEHPQELNLARDIDKAEEDFRTH